MKILIVGAGIGGLAVAAFLKKQNHNITIIEKARNFENIGFLLTIFPNARKILKKLKIDQEISKKGITYRGHDILNKKGENLCFTDFGKIGDRHGNIIEIERNALHKELIKINKNTKINFNRTIKDLRQNKKKVVVTFKNNKKESFDLVIGADGIHSSTRKYVEPQSKEDYTGSTFWITWMPKKFKFPKRSFYQFGEGKFFSIFPCKKKDRVVAWFVSSSKERHQISKKNSVQFIEEHFEDLGGVIRDVIKSLPTKPDLIYHHDDNETHLKKWHKGRVVLLGDSVHALSPILGMGASMALEDAMVLSEEITKCGKEDLERAFQNYRSRRFPRVNFLAKISKQSHAAMNAKKPISWARDIFLKHIFNKIYLKRMDKFLSEEI